MQSLGHCGADYERPDPATLKIRMDCNPTDLPTRPDIAQSIVDSGTGDDLILALYKKYYQGERIKFIDYQTPRFSNLSIIKLVDGFIDEFDNR